MGCAAVVVLATLGTILSYIAGDKAGTPIVGVTPDHPEVIEQARSLVTRLEKAGGIVRWSCTGNSAYVSEDVWAAFDVDAK